MALIFLSLIFEAAKAEKRSRGMACSTDLRRMILLGSFKTRKVQEEIFFSRDEGCLPISCFRERYQLGVCQGIMKRGGTSRKTQKSSDVSLYFQGDIEEENLVFFFIGRGSIGFTKIGENGLDAISFTNIHDTY